MRRFLNFWSETKTTHEIVTTIRSLVTEWKCRDEMEVELWFSQQVFTIEVALVLTELFSWIAETRSNNYDSDDKCHRIVSRIRIDRCQGIQYINQSVEAALTYDAIEELSLDGQCGITYDVITKKRATTAAFPIHLQKLHLQNLSLSRHEIQVLKSWALGPKLRESGGGLKRFSLCEITFADDETIRVLGEILSTLSQTTGRQPNEDQEQQHTPGRFLEFLWLYYCNLEDRHMELLLGSLRTVHCPSTETTTIRNRSDSAFESCATESVAIHSSTLKSLIFEQERCGPKFYSALGAWLLNLNDPFQPCTHPHKKCSCSLETINITAWSSKLTSINPIESLAERLPASFERDANICSTINNTMDETVSGTNALRGRNSIQKKNGKINNTLKNFCISGVNDMGFLGRFIVQHLLGLEHLTLVNTDRSDKGLTVTGFASFVNGLSMFDEEAKENGNIDRHHQYHRNLRELNLYSSGRSVRKQLESSSHMARLLECHPTLYQVRFGFKWNEETLDEKIQHLMNTNAAGRYFFVPSFQNHLPIAIWPRVLERFYTSMITSKHYDKSLRSWVESGSEGDSDSEHESQAEIDVSHDDHSEGNDDDNVDDNDDNDDDDNDNNHYDEEEINDDINTSRIASNVVGKQSRERIQQAASAIFSLLRFNIDLLVRLQSKNNNNKEEKKKQPQQTLSIKITSDLPMENSAHHGVCRITNQGITRIPRTQWKSEQNSLLARTQKRRRLDLDVPSRDSFRIQPEIYFRT